MSNPTTDDVGAPAFVMFDGRGWMQWPDGSKVPAASFEYAREIERLQNLIDYHNHSCQKACGFGELEAVACGYRCYFLNNGRRCTNCPTDWKIER